MCTVIWCVTRQKLPKTFVIWLCSSQNQFVPELVRQDLFYIKFFFFKLSILYIGSLDKCYSSAFGALIYLQYLLFFDCSKATWITLGSTGLFYIMKIVIWFMLHYALRVCMVYGHDWSTLYRLSSNSPTIPNYDMLFLTLKVTLSNLQKSDNIKLRMFFKGLITLLALNFWLLSVFFFFCMDQTNMCEYLRHEIK